MKAPCPDCGRVVGVTKVGGMYAHSQQGQNGWRCPGSGKAPLAPEPVPEMTAFQIGDRVVRYPDGPYGIVTMLDSDGRVFCHWGTQSYPDNSAGRGEAERRFEDWVSPAELKLEENVIWAGDPETGEKQKVWDPKERRAEEP